MQLNKAREFYKHKLITNFVAVKATPDNWFLSIIGKKDEVWKLKTAKNETKYFSSLDSLIKEVERITGGVVDVLNIRHK